MTDGRPDTEIRAGRISRRQFLVGSGLSVVAGAAAAVGFSRLPALGRKTDAKDAAERPWYELGLFNDELMDQRLLYKLGQAWYVVADVGEVLDTALRIEDGQPASWRAAWFRTADRVRAMGDDSRSRGHPVSAGEAWLRACSYYVAGLIYNESPDDADLVQASIASARTFSDALRLLGIPGEPVEIPYENAALPGYFLRSKLGGDAQVLIVHQGMDAAVEESLYLATGATRRGCHALLLHHPGQGRALRELGLTFRPDWESVITPVVDFALTQPNVDPTRVMLNGLSFGGSLVTRAVAFEKRVWLCIPNPAHYSWWGFISNEFFSLIPKSEALSDGAPGPFNAAVNTYLKTAPTMHSWWFQAAM